MSIFEQAMLKILEERRLQLAETNGNTAVLETPEETSKEPRTFTLEHFCVKCTVCDRWHWLDGRAESRMKGEEKIRCGSHTFILSESELIKEMYTEHEYSRS